MPTTNNLTDALCRRAAPSEKPRKLFDGNGLHLFITPAGGKRWRMAYRQGGKPQTATFGAYPLVSLAEARQKRDALLKALESGESPKASRHHGVTLKSACETYWGGRKDVSEGYRSNALRGLAMHLYPALGNRPIGEIKRDELFAALARMDAAGKHVYVRRVRMWVGQVFDWAVERGLAPLNLSQTIRPEKAFGKKPVESFAALELNEVAPFFARLELEKDLQSVLACKMLALTWVRTKELRAMRWADIDGDLWRIADTVMKKDRDHLVPLSAQALALLDVLRARKRPGSDLVFPAEHRDDRAISENAVLALIARMGYRGRMTGHGWRSVASTWANENDYAPDVIERQLSHVPKDETRSVYNRAKYLPQRRELMQSWADWLVGQGMSI